MDDVAVARAFHVLSIVLWIGGVALITLSILPAAIRGEFGGDRIAVFEAVERRFARIARASVFVAGLSGLYMVARLDLWDRFRHVEFWWMHAMILVWTIFAAMLFIGEPLVLHQRLHDWGRRDPGAALAALRRSHVVLLTLSLITVFGAVAGAHGWSPF